MKVVIGDVEVAALETTVAELRAGGADVTGVRVDVTSFDSVSALADAAYEAHGAVHVLVNNAGVGPPGGLVWDSTPNDWTWTFRVNVFGVAHGVQAFVPRMIAGGEEGVVVNTSSTDGPIAPMPQAACYAATKCAVTCLTECLDAQLRSEGTEPHRRRLLPLGQGPARHRALDLGPQPARGAGPRAPRSTPAMTVAELAEKGIPVQPLDELAVDVVDGIRDGRFVIVLDVDRHAATLRARAEKIAARENPTEAHQLGGL